MNDEQFLSSTLNPFINLITFNCNLIRWDQSLAAWKVLFVCITSTTQGICGLANSWSRFKNSKTQQNPGIKVATSTARGNSMDSRFKLQAARSWRTQRRVNLVVWQSCDNIILNAESMHIDFPHQSLCHCCALTFQWLLPFFLSWRFPFLYRSVTCVLYSLAHGHRFSYNAAWWLLLLQIMMGGANAAPMYRHPTPTTATRQFC